MPNPIKGNQHTKKVLSFIKRYISKYGYPPTYQEIADGTGLSIKHAWRATAVLESEGELRRGPRRTSRTIALVRPGSAR